jgi:hypothetical protein
MRTSIGKPSPCKISLFPSIVFDDPLQRPCVEKYGRPAPQLARVRGSAACNQRPAMRFRQQPGERSRTQIIKKMGFVPSHEEKGRLFKKYWTVPGRQIETSVVLADSKESTSFSARPIRFTYRNRLHRVRTENNVFWRKIS